MLILLQLVGVETMCGTGEPGAISVGQLGTLLACSLGKLLLVDGQFRLEVVDEQLLPSTIFLAVPSRIVPMNKFNLPYSFLEVIVCMVLSYMV